MKKLLICLLLFLSTIALRAQDKIITIQHDTIECCIVTITPVHIHYEQPEGNGYVVGRLISTEEVLKYYRIPPTYYKKEKKPAEKPNRPWIIGVQAGKSILLASTANDKAALIGVGIPKSQAEEYAKNMKNGFHLNGDVYYKLTNLFGLGLKYSFFTSSAELNSTVPIFFYQTSYGPSYSHFIVVGAKEKQYINYVGPSVIFQQWLGNNRKFQLSQMLSIGYMSYRGEVRTDPTTFASNPVYIDGPNTQIFGELVEGKTWAGTVGLSAEYYLLPCLSVGANAGLIGTLPIKEVDHSNKLTTGSIGLPKYNYLKLSRFDYSLNIRLHF